MSVIMTICLHKDKFNLLYIVALSRRRYRLVSASSRSSQLYMFLIDHEVSLKKETLLMPFSFGHFCVISSKFAAWEELLNAYIRAAEGIYVCSQNRLLPPCRRQALSSHQPYCSSTGRAGS